VCAVVVMVRVVAPDALPDGRLPGAKLADDCGGRFDAPKLIAAGMAPPCVAKLSKKVAFCPAVIVTGCVGPVTEKSSMTKLSEPEGPPPGDALETVTLAVPTVASDVAGTVAVRVVPLFVTVPGTETPLKMSDAPD
jgi:hypothetical protein